MPRRTALTYVLSSLTCSPDESVEAGINRILAENKRLDIVVHNAGHMVFGPAEAFTPEQLAELYDVNAAEYSAREPRGIASVAKAEERARSVGFEQQRSRRNAAYLAPYFAAKAGMDAMAVVYARELTRWASRPQSLFREHSLAARITSRTAGSPADKVRAAEIRSRSLQGIC